MIALPEWLTPWRRKSAITPVDILGELLRGNRSKSGAAVTWQTALEVTTALACARVIAEGIAQVPLKLFRESPDGKTRLPATDHPLYQLLHRRPNPWQTSYEYREQLGLHLVFTGNAYSYKNVVLGAVRELVPFEPQHVTVNRAAGGALTYAVTLPDGTGQRTFQSSEIWHLRGPSWCGWLGLEAVRLAREAIGLALSTEQTHADFHSRGAKMSGTYSVEGALNKEQFELLYQWIEKYRTGGEKAGGAMILDRSAKWVNQQMTGVDSQHIETRKFQIEEVCRAMRVMPIMVGYSDKASTYASAEQMFLAHVVHTLSPWYERIEQSIDAQLLTPKDAADGVYAKFVAAGLLRGSLQTTKDYLLGLVNGGLMTPNEGREKLELNPDPDPASNELRVPANIVGDPGKPDDEPKDTGE